MSSFGGMDRGVEGDAPYMGRIVAWQEAEGVFWPGMVLAVREDGWTVSLRVAGETHEFVPYGGNDEFGTIPVGSWVTLDAYEGWKIYAAERAAQRQSDPED